MRRGMTLVEMMVAFGIAMLVGGVITDLMLRAGRLMDGTVRGGGVQQDAALALERIVRDVGSAQVLFEPQVTGQDAELVIARAVDDEVRATLEKNATWAFPFSDAYAENDTVQRTPSLRVTYRFDAGRATLTRREELGELVARSGDDRRELTSWSFEPTETLSEKVVLASLRTFAVRPVGYDAEHKLTAPAWPKAAGVVVRLAARSEGAVARGNSAMVPLEVLTTAWVPARRSDEVYAEYFSSTDADASW